MLIFQKTIHDYGVVYNCNSIHVVFGNKKLTLNEAKKIFPHINFVSINQKHTTKISNPTTPLEVADGHQWIQKNYSCVIRTADCLPLIIVNHDLDQITNLHCGRVGLVDGILSEFLKTTNVDHNYSFFIGPHIETYEIGQDLFNSLSSRFSDDLYIENNKFYFSLASYTKKFLVKHFKSYKIYECGINTYSDKNYWSYRIDKLTPFRNLNFAFVGKNEL